MSGGGYVLPQLDDYTYDELNRIKSVTEAQLNSSGGWTFNLFTQNFNYDRLGNRTVSCSPCQPGVTGDVFTIDAATNRITAKNGTGMTYDAAGNQTYDATGNRWFDGENRMHKATQGGTTSHYVYDADGKRVRRIIGSTETWMIYGVDGELVGEYAAAASATSPQKEYGYRGGQMLIVAQTSPLEIRWTVPDHLGTPRMNIRGTGTDGGSLASVTRHDYLPFGEELFAGVGLRSSSHGYEPPADGVRQKFTGYERDGETGLDFAEARYCSSVQGRFTSLDPLMASAQVANPQTWNRYTYALNNPLRNVDPDGLEAKPVFKPYDQLTEDERRILENSKITVGKGKDAKVLSGSGLYNHLSQHNQKELANFLNQTAVLGGVKFDNGRSALSYVNSVSEFKQDRIIAEVDAGLKDQVAAISGEKSKDGKRYIGPEDSGIEHGIFDVSFRENIKEGAQQLSFASSLKFGRADIDIDYGNPYAGGGLRHAGEVMQNKIFRTKTNPYKVYDQITKRPGAGIKPSYTLSDK